MVHTSKMKTTRNTKVVMCAVSGTTAVTPDSTKTKQQLLQERLVAPDSASLQQLSDAFGWQPHTVRAAISGLRKAGQEVQRGTVEGAWVYRIVTAGQG